MNLMVDEGDTIKLPCYADNTKDLILIWKKGTTILALGRQLMNKQDSRVKLEPGDNGNTLVISLAESDDAGQYTCQLSASKPRELKHNVEIRVAPAVKPVPSNGVLVVHQGQAATLQCDAFRGSPRPNIYWRRRERKLLSGEDEIQGESLTLPRTTRHDSGVYICRADNGFKSQKPAEAIIKLDVQHAPLVEQEQTFIHTREDDETEVICIVHASPRATVEWFKNGEPLQDDQGIVSVRGNRHTLLLPGIKESTFGSYMCKATNDFGSDERITDVSGLASPANMKSKPYGDEDHSFWLDWTSESITAITEFRVQWRQEGAGEHGWSEPMPSEKEPPRHNGDHTYEGWLTLQGLRPATHYDVRIASKNAYGWSPYGEIFTFGTKGADLYKLNGDPLMETNEIAPLQQPSTTAASSPLTTSSALLLGCLLSLRWAL